MARLGEGGTGGQGDVNAGQVVGNGGGGLWGQTPGGGVGWGRL